MFERFTERARQIVVLAQEEARRGHSEYIGTGHLMLGMMGEEETVAYKVLVRECGLLADDIREFLGMGDAGEPLGGQIPFTASGKKLLERCLREALSLGHNYIGTEHMLLGLLESPGEMDDFLSKKLGTNWDEVIRLEVMEQLRGDTEPRVKKEPEKSADEKDAIELRDILDDLLIGYKMWHEGKIENATLTVQDEAFIRWVEGSRANEYL